MPRKAIREALESDETDLGFEFFLADRLRMTVGRLRREMSSAEFAHWAVWHGIRAQRMELESERLRG